jgi:hypothetical protein
VDGSYVCIGCVRSSSLLVVADSPAEARFNRGGALSLNSPFLCVDHGGARLSAQADEEGRREQGSPPTYPPWTRLGLEGGSSTIHGNGGEYHARFC